MIMVINKAISCCYRNMFLKSCVLIGKLFRAFALRASSLIVLLSFCCFIDFVNADDNSNLAELPADLTEIGIKNLLDFDLIVTSPGKKEQPVSEVASSVFVLTR